MKENRAANGSRATKMTGNWKYRDISFHCTLLYCASKILCFYKLKVPGKLALSKSMGAIFQQHYFSIKVCAVFRQNAITLLIDYSVL